MPRITPLPTIHWLAENTAWLPPLLAGGAFCVARVLLRRREGASGVLAAVMLAGALAPTPAASQALEIDLTQAPQSQAIVPGPATDGWSYAGTVRTGPASALVPVPGSYLGPTIHVMQGQDLTIRLTNLIGEDSTTHWHGLDVPDAMDGHPRFAFASGTTYTYAFPVLNRAGTYWYHPHPDMRTGGQVYAGLAGFLVVHDAEEAAIALPQGEFDVPLCIQDATFDAGNQRVYDPDMTNGFFGDTILVNGKPDYVHSAATRIYRLRLLNGSVSRIYKLAFNDATPVVVIGNDGGLLDAPRELPYVMLAPGERVELWADFSSHAAGSLPTLQSLAFTATGGQGAAVDVMRFSIDRVEPESLVLPPALTTITPFLLADAVNAASPKTYAIGMAMIGADMTFTLNGAPFSMTAVAANEVARCNTLEVIRVTNTSGMMEIPHPIHFHGRPFQILDRSVTAGGLASWNTVKDGFVDAGWKDTLLVMPGETVRILVRHGGYPGVYNYHCHNLEHEDMGMMRNFRLEPNPETLCGDGTDDDDDGLVDCADPDCVGVPGVAEAPCDGLDNDCDPGTPDQIDADGDGFACGADCDDADGAAWAVPGEARSLFVSFSRMTGIATLTWTPPLDLGGLPSSLMHDTLRSTSASDFVSAAMATCLESDDSADEVATDPQRPPPLFFYLVRAENACGSSGDLGRSSRGTPRIGLDCP